jgi:long-subunit fatty acid transport protein
LNNQSAFQTRTITSTFAPFAGNGGDETKTFEGKTTAPFIPSLFAAYKMDKWVFSANIGVIGGGGKIAFDDGLGSFESQISMLPLQLSQNGITTNKYSADIYMEGSSIIYDGQLGVTYAINDMFSVYAGGRINLANNSYVGHIRDISINPLHPMLNPAGEMMLATTFFGNAQQAAQGVANSLQPIIDQGAGELPLSQIMSPEDLAQLAGGLGKTPEEVGAWNALQAQGAYNQAAKAYGENAAATANKELDCKQSGMGITPILGFNFNWRNLNVGVKYEFVTKLDIKNTTKVDDVNQFPDGEKIPNDLPAWLSIGAQYKVVPSVKVSAGYHHFFDSDAKMANDKQKHIDGGINEFLLGAEWQINKMFLVSAGGQMTKTGVTDLYQTDMSYSLNSFSAGFGGAVNVTEKIRINLAYFFTKYEDWTKEFPNYNGLPFPGKDVYSRTNNVFGIGIDYHF